jgi:hypothetical protein
MNTDGIQVGPMLGICVSSRCSIECIFDLAGSRGMHWKKLRHQVGGGGGDGLTLTKFLEPQFLSCFCHGFKF